MVTTVGHNKFSADEVAKTILTDCRPFLKAAKGNMLFHGIKLDAKDFVAISRYFR